MVEVEAILLATTPTLENYRIDRYLGVVSTHVMIEESEFQKLQDADVLNSNIDADELLKEIEEEMSEESKTAKVEVGLEEIQPNLDHRARTAQDRLLEHIGSAECDISRRRMSQLFG